MTSIAAEVGLSVSRVSRLIAAQEARSKASYLAKTGELSCSDGAKPVERDDAVKT
jgi:hypothetical protein